MSKNLKEAKMKKVLVICMIFFVTLSFNGTYYTAYRPYRYSDGTTPTNRPFVHVMKNPLPNSFS